MNTKTYNSAAEVDWSTSTIEPAFKETAGEHECTLSDLKVVERSGRSAKGTWNAKVMQFIVNGKKYWLTVNEELANAFNEVGKKGRVDVVESTGRYTEFTNLSLA